MMETRTPPAVLSELAEGEERRWDAFVAAHPEAGFYHRAGWKSVIERSFDHRCHFLQVTRGSELRGVLPLVHVKSPLFGDALIATAFCVGGGAVALDAAALTLLLERAEELAVALDVDRLELRAPAPEREGWFDRTGLHVGFVRSLDPDPDVDFANLRRKQRNMVRKGEKYGMTSRIDEDVDRFFDIYSTSVHHLGTPVYARKFFVELQRVFADSCDVLTVERDGRAVATVLSFYHEATVLACFAGSLPGEMRHGANDFMYHALMRHAVLDRKCRKFDFGRSKVGSGHADFKRHWGFEAEPLRYGYWLPSGEPPPEVNPRNPKYRMFIEAWRRLPLGLTRLIGPPIARQIG
ncbi:MAG: FemAB family PEP-CTERM system-associated protein [Geminicoccaceae bacterium]|nr:FemAB family PEP-CTERM system-associated protein [Geminicoccaceae bacterium]